MIRYYVVGSIFLYCRIDIFHALKVKQEKKLVPFVYKKYGPRNIVLKI